MATKKHIFTPYEKKNFAIILKKYSRIIESKGTDGSTLKAKNEAWHSVTKEYNASSHATIQVTSKQLRRLWMNLKQRQKEVLARERQRRFLALGRGLATSDAVDPDAPVTPVFVDINSEVSESTITVKQEELSPISIFYGPSEGPSASTSSGNPATLQLTNSLLTPSSPPSASTPPPPQSTLKSDAWFQRHKKIILEKEYGDKQRRAEELHALEVELLRQKIREAKAKANLAELILFRQQQIRDVSEVGN